MYIYILYSISAHGNSNSNLPSIQLGQSDLVRFFAPWKRLSVVISLYSINLSWLKWLWHTPLKFNSSPLKSSLPNRKVIFQPTIFEGQAVKPSGGGTYAIHQNLQKTPPFVRRSRCLEQASEEFDRCQGAAPWWSFVSLNLRSGNSSKVGSFRPTYGGFPKMVGFPVFPPFHTPKCWSF